MSNKSIDINQRIPIDTLYVALQSYLNVSYSNEYVLEQLRLEFEGENRLKKALRIVNKIILKNPLNELILEYKSEIENAIKIKADRDVIIIALLNSAFPFSFEVVLSQCLLKLVFLKDRKLVFMRNPKLLNYSIQ
jgi:hypothetical protein